MRVSSIVCTAAKSCFQKQQQQQQADVHRHGVHIWTPQGLLALDLSIIVMCPVLFTLQDSKCLQCEALLECVYWSVAEALFEIPPVALHPPHHNSGVIVFVLLRSPLWHCTHLITSSGVIGNTITPLSFACQATHLFVRSFCTRLRPCSFKRFAERSCLIFHPPCCDGSVCSMP